jgi:hypothetical protein
MRWILIGSHWWVAAHEPVRPGLLPLVESTIVFRHLGVVWINLCTLCLDLKAEKTYLLAERVESAINDVESVVVVLSLNIDPPIKVLPILMLSQADVLQMLQNILHVGVRSRMVGRVAGRRAQGSGSWLRGRTWDVLHCGVRWWCKGSRRRYICWSAHDVL